MSTIDHVLKVNSRFAPGYDPLRVSPYPRLALAVLTCMDTRLSLKALGLKEGDAHIIRNAGGIATDDALRSILVSHHVLGTREVMVINHTDCGLMKATEEELQRTLEQKTGRPASRPVRFGAFKDVEENVRQQMAAIASHSWLGPGLVVRGFVFDVHTGQLREV